ncbi:MAG: PAAR domain-containing protein [Thermoanaerobaculia bacterium]
MNHSSFRLAGLGTYTRPMGKPAARLSDQVLQDAPHCHAPIHPPALVPTPVPHPALPLPLIKGAGTVMIGNLPAARITDTTSPCTLPGCVPGGPGMVAIGGFTVLIENLPAARVGDMTAHTSCVAPIPSPTGKVLPPGCPTVLIGG